MARLLFVSVCLVSDERIRMMSLNEGDKTSTWPPHHALAAAAAVCECDRVGGIIPAAICKYHLKNGSVCLSVNARSCVWLSTSAYLCVSFIIIMHERTCVISAFDSIYMSIDIYIDRGYQGDYVCIM